MICVIYMVKIWRKISLILENCFLAVSLSGILKKVLNVTCLILNLPL